MSFVLWQNWINQETRTTLLPVRVNSSNHLIRSKMRHCQSIFKLIYNHLVLTRLPNWSTCYLATTNRCGDSPSGQMHSRSIKRTEYSSEWMMRCVMMRNNTQRAATQIYSPHACHYNIFFVLTHYPHQCTLVTHNQPCFVPIRSLFMNCPSAMVPPISHLISHPNAN